MGKSVNEEITEIINKYHGDMKMKSEIGLVFQDRIRRIIKMIDFPRREIEKFKKYFPFDMGRSSGFNECRFEIQKIIDKIREIYRL